MSKLPKQAHLILSASIVIVMAFVYGSNPSVILFDIFGFKVQDLELKNIFRAIMGVYFALGVYWLYGVVKPMHWERATLFNVLFMGGLTAGRLISTLLDGWSPQYGLGMIGEAILTVWGLWNLNYYTQKNLRSRS